MRKADSGEPYFPIVEQDSRKIIPIPSHHGRFPVSMRSTLIGKRSALAIDSLLDPEPHACAKVPRTLPASKSPNPRSKQLSRLETLPTELLETIFQQCLNFNLPATSLVISRKLSSKHIKTWLLSNTFWSGWEGGRYYELFGMTQPKKLAEFQSSVLRRRWVTLQFLRQSIPDFMIHTLLRELGPKDKNWLRVPGLLSGIDVKKYVESVLPTEALAQKVYSADQYIKVPSYSPFRCIDCTWDEAPPSKCRGKFEFDAIDGCIELTIKDPDAQDESARDHTTNWHILSCVTGTQIPSKLLHGPWDPEKCDLLSMVLRGNASIDWINTTTGELARQGLFQAIKENNAQAVTTLLHRKQFMRDLDIGLTPSEVQAYQGTGLVADTEMLRFAIRKCACKTAIVAALLDAKEARMDAYDPAIWAWMHEMRFNGDEKLGEWLYEELKQFAAARTYEETRVKKMVEKTYWWRSSGKT